MTVEAGQLVREALDGWLRALNLSPEQDVVADQAEPGERPAFPHVGMAWGPVTSTGERLTAESVADDVDGAPGAVVWLVGYDEVAARFVMRATTAEDADRVAHEFRGRFALEAARSNTSGDPVLHFDVTIGGATRSGKVYLDGTFNPPQPKDVDTRSLYEQAVGAVVAYPRFWVEDLGDETGQMTVSVTLNGVAYTLPEET